MLYTACPTVNNIGLDYFKSNNYYNNMNELLPWLKGLTLTGLITWFLWWKSTLHKEIVKPDVDKINSRIDFLENRTDKLEELYDRISDNLERKIDKLQETISILSKEVAQLSGQLKAMSKND